MQYVLTGFTHDNGFRVFAFEGIKDDGVRTVYNVKADLALVRKHGILLQELPLLCRAILERRGDQDDQRAFTYTEGDMSLHADLIAALHAVRRKRPRRMPTAETADRMQLT